MERLNTPEFIRQDAVPFALTACERFEAQPVKGIYDDINQVWQGKDAAAALTLTLTATPGDTPDNDQD